MSLETELTRITSGMKSALKTIINKLGGNVNDETVDYFSALANAIPEKQNKIDLITHIADIPEMITDESMIICKEAKKMYVAFGEERIEIGGSEEIANGLYELQQYVGSELDRFTSMFDAHAYLSTNPHNISTSIIGAAEKNHTHDTYVLNTEKGAASGIAMLDESGTIVRTQFPSDIAFYSDLDQMYIACVDVTNAHMDDDQNPHGVTASQVGAALTDHKHDGVYEVNGAAQNALNEAKEYVDSEISNLDFSATIHRAYVVVDTELTEVNIPLTITDATQISVYMNGLLLQPILHYTATTTAITLVGFSAHIGDYFTFLSTAEAGATLESNSANVLLSSTTNFTGLLNVQQALDKLANAVENVDVPIMSIKYGENELTPVDGVVDVGIYVASQINNAVTLHNESTSAHSDIRTALNTHTHNIANIEGITVSTSDIIGGTTALPDNTFYIVID